MKVIITQSWENVSKSINTLRTKEPKDSFQFLEMSRLRFSTRQVREEIQESMKQVSPFISSFTHYWNFFFNKCQALIQALRTQQYTKQRVLTIDLVWQELETTINKCTINI